MLLFTMVLTSKSTLSSFFVVPCSSILVRRPRLSTSALAWHRGIAGIFLVCHLANASAVELAASSALEGLSFEGGWQSCSDRGVDVPSYMYLPLRSLCHESLQRRTLCWSLCLTFGSSHRRHLVRRQVWDVHPRPWRRQHRCPSHISIRNSSRWRIHTSKGNLLPEIVYS